MNSKSIAVFDSGLGSISVIREIRNQISHENIIYFADRENFPYGKKSIEELEQIGVNAINILSSFSPKIIIVASITPSIRILNRIKSITSIPILGITIPLKQASKFTKKRHIGILGTTSTIKSKQLEEQIRLEVPQSIFVTRFDASSIIEIIEQGTFLTNERFTLKIISETLGNLKDMNIDVLVLSSTHLSLIKSPLFSMYPSLKIVDPTNNAVKGIKQFLILNNLLKKNGPSRIRIIMNGEKKEFQSLIKIMGLPGPIETIQNS